MVAADLKHIYAAATKCETEQCLTEFEAKWHDAYPPIAQSWPNNWTRVNPLRDYPTAIRLHHLRHFVNKLSLPQFGAIVD